MKRIAPTLLALLLAAAPASLRAQGVTGTVVDQIDGTPVPGALVTLVSADGHTRRQALADRAGHFSLRAPTAGRYTLRAERIGYGTATSPPLELAAGQTVDYRLATPSRRVQLQALVVSADDNGSRRCTVRPQAGEESATLWDEARKALEAAVTTRQQYPYRFKSERRIRVLDPATLTVRHEEVRAMEGFSDNPFVAVSPERLARTGYVETLGDTVFFHAPDAAVLLSDPFLESHCFRSRRPDGEHQGMVGLAFEPVRDAGNADVTGVLWLDAQTAELRTVDYRYTHGSMAPAVNDRAGGRVEFKRLPSGAWIVTRWRILMPAGQAPGPINSSPIPNAQTTQRVALAEESGQVVEVRDARGAPVEMVAFATLSGVVFDSTRNRPLAGASVSLAGTGDSTRTDAAGRFTLAHLAEGAYALVFDHPRLDSLHFTPEPAHVDMVPPAELHRDLAVPSMASILASSCRTPPGSAVGVVGGIVSNRAGGAPLPGIPVTAEWSAPGGEPGRSATVTDEAGGYRFCDVPAGAAVRVAARLARDSATAEAAAQQGTPVQRDLALTAPAGFAAQAAGAGAVRVVIHVIDPAGGRAIEGMRVEMAGFPGAATDRRGIVAFPAVPPGSYAVALSHPAYGAATARLTVHGPGTAEFELPIPRRNVILAPLNAVARRLYPGEFNERSRGRRLNVVTREEIERREGVARDVGDLVRVFPALTVTEVQYRYGDTGTGIVKEVCITPRSGPRNSSLVTLASRNEQAAASRAQHEGDAGVAPASPQREQFLASLQEQCEGNVAVAVDDMIMAGMSGEFLRNFPIQQVESVFYLSPAEAVSRFGYAGANGVIMIYTRGNGPTVRGQ